MKNRYLVSNLIGIPLARCNNSTEVHKFVMWHVEKSKDAYKFLTGETLSFCDYKVTDLQDIPEYKDLDLTPIE